MGAAHSPDGSPAPAGPPRAPRAGRRQALLLALLVHCALLGLLFVGLKWQSQPPVPVQAELWTTAPPAAVPGPVRPAPPPEPRPEPPAESRPEPEPRAQVKPEPKPAPRADARAEPPPAPRPPAKAQPKAEPAESADIRTERARQESELRQADEKRRKEEQQRREAERREVADRKEAERRNSASKEAERKEAERRDAERKAAERKSAEERQQREESERREALAAETRRAEDIRRMQQQAAAGASAEAPARAAQAGGTNDAAYRAKVAAAIRSNTTFQIPSDLEGNPRAIFAVQLRPDCSVASVRLRRSSGNSAWDQAAERGIQRTDPFPRPAEGSCSGDIEISRGPRDQR